MYPKPLYLQRLVHILTIFFIIVVILNLNIERRLLQHCLDAAEALCLLQSWMIWFIILYLLLLYFYLFFASCFLTLQLLLIHFIYLFAQVELGLWVQRWFRELGGVDCCCGRVWAERAWESAMVRGHLRRVGSARDGFYAAWGEIVVLICWAWLWKEVDLVLSHCCPTKLFSAVIDWKGQILASLSSLFHGKTKSRFVRFVHHWHQIDPNHLHFSFWFAICTNLTGIDLIPAISVILIHIMTQIEFADIHKVMHTWRVIDVDLLYSTSILSGLFCICSQLIQ